MTPTKRNDPHKKVRPPPKGMASTARTPLPPPGDQATTQKGVNPPPDCLYRKDAGQIGILGGNNHFK